MRFSVFAFLLVVAFGRARAAEEGSIIGQVQPEIRLTDGTVLTKAKIVSYSVEKEKKTATIAEPTRIRTVELEKLPVGLRDKILTEAGMKSETPITKPKGRRTRVAPTPPSPPPADKTILPEVAVSTPVAPGMPATVSDALLKQAGTAAADELKFYLTKAFDRAGGLTCKVREIVQVPGWQKIRVSGEASFTQWDAKQADHVWRTDKFEVEYSIVDGNRLKAETVAFAGISRPVGER